MDITKIDILFWEFVFGANGCLEQFLHHSSGGAFVVGSILVRSLAVRSATDYIVYKPTMCLASNGSRNAFATGSCAGMPSSSTSCPAALFATLSLRISRRVIFHNFVCSPHGATFASPTSFWVMFGMILSVLQFCSQFVPYGYSVRCLTFLSSGSPCLRWAQWWGCAILRGDVP